MYQGFREGGASYRGSAARIERGISKLSTEAYRKAAEILKDKEGAIDPATFRRFDPAMIREDQIKVERRLAELESNRSPRDQEIKEFATVFEAIFDEQAELADWLGSDTVIRKAAEYDDLFHGVDSIAEFSGDESVSHLALGIDVTSSEQGVAKKFEIIKQLIDRGSLVEIRYFQSFLPGGDLRFEGSLYNVPKGVVAMDRVTIAELARLWVKGENKALGAHPIQLQILQQLQMQMEIFVEYAKRQGKKNLVPPLTEALTRLRSIQASKQKRALAQTATAQTFLRNDRMLAVVRSELRRVFQQSSAIYSAVK